MEKYAYRQTIKLVNLIAERYPKRLGHQILIHFSFFSNVIESKNTFTLAKSKKSNLKYKNTKSNKKILLY